MNKPRRKQLEIIAKEMQSLLERLEEIAIEEQDSYDSIPDSLKYTEQAEKSEEVISMMDEVTEHLEESIELLNQIVEG